MVPVARAAQVVRLAQVVQWKREDPVLASAAEVMKSRLAVVASQMLFPQAMPPQVLPCLGLHSSLCDAGVHKKLPTIRSTLSNVQLDASEL